MWRLLPRVDTRGYLLALRSQLLWVVCDRCTDDTTKNKEPRTKNRNDVSDYFCRRTLTPFLFERTMSGFLSLFMS